MSSRGWALFQLSTERWSTSWSPPLSPHMVAEPVSAPGPAEPQAVSERARARAVAQHAAAVRVVRRLRDSIVFRSSTLRDGDRNISTIGRDPGTVEVGPVVVKRPRMQKIWRTGLTPAVSDPKLPSAKKFRDLSPSGDRKPDAD